jgi:ribonucleases P/MRP protein subunit RPP40
LELEPEPEPEPHCVTAPAPAPTKRGGSLRLRLRLRNTAGNYRPVSLTSVPCKILESLIEEEITAHLDRNRLINESQHGFMRGRSCATNIIEFMEIVTKSVDKGESVDIFYLDFSKAFDKVPRERLIVKLKAKGIQGELIDWLRNWLSERVQTVKVRGAESEEQDIESGVPQGTVLGPCLFKIHIDDIDEVVRQLVDLLSKFADDTKGAKIIRSRQDAEILQEALNKLCEWAKTWGMSFNEKKCKIMHIGRNNPQYSYYMSGTKLSEIEEEKDVGVVIHKSLKPARQCERAAAVATGVLMQLVKCFHYRDRNVFLRLYTQYVRPHLEFATLAWSPWLLSDIHTLEKVQERAVRLIAGLTSNDYKERCKELGLETLQERRHIQDMAQVYKLINNVDKVSRVKLFDHVPEGRTRLAADQLNIRAELCRTDIRKNFFTQRVINAWNNIDSALKSSINVHVFKSNYRKTRIDGTP